MQTIGIIILVYFISAIVSFITVTNILKDEKFVEKITKLFGEGFPIFFLKVTVYFPVINTIILLVTIHCFLQILVNKMNIYFFTRENNKQQNET